MIDWQDFPITDGTDQRERMPPAFAPNYFDVDERSFEKLLAMGAEIAARLKYYDLANRADGNWGDLFEADEAVVMATMLSIDLVRLESDFRAIPHDRPDAQVAFLLRLARRFDRWYHRLAAVTTRQAEVLTQTIETLIVDKLAPALREIGRIVEDAGIETEIDPAGFTEVWTRAPAVPAAPPGDEIMPALKANYYLFANAIGYLQNTAAQHLRQSLHSQRHDPAIGLFMVFLRLFERAQDRLNRFTARHLDFYYRQVLAAHNRPRTADSYYLLLTARAGAGRLRIDKDTAFSAGQDADLNEIVYRADESLLLGDVEVGSLLTLHLQQDRLNSPEADVGMVTRVKAGRPALKPDTDAVDEAAADAWPLFGAGPGSADARLGFAIASPLLLLQQGRRRVEIGFKLEPAVAIEPAKRIERLTNCSSRREFRRDFAAWFALYLLRFDGAASEAHKSALIERAQALLTERESAEIASLLREDWQGLFYRLFKQPLNLRLSGEAGWFEVVNPAVLPLSEQASGAETGFRLLFELAAADPPVTAYQAALHGDELDTNLPVLQCEINPQAHFCIFSVLQDLLVERLDIEVSVSGIRDVQVYNQNGQLDASKPFQPFGPAPAAGSYFVLGNYEMAQKQLSGLRLHLDWAGLPAGDGGFGGHYAGYATAMDNNCFEADFSALCDGSWLPAESPARACFKLFDTRAEDDGAAARRSLEVADMGFARAVDPVPPAADFRYDLKTRGGFYRLTLTQPQNGFGHGDYTSLLTSVLAANARKKKPDPVPNPPYTPALAGLSVDYRARSSLLPALERNARTRLFHLHPFGSSIVYPESAQQACHLLPQYSWQGNLFIGLRGGDIAGPLSLLFHLAQDRIDPASAGSARFQWFYLADDCWRPLPEKNLLANTTHDFLASGKVTLEIPPDISRGNRIMPAQYYWLRLAVDRAADAFSGCYFVKPHALKVSRDVEAAAAAAGPDDAARQNQWSLLQSRSGVGGISQAFAAFGGRAAESDAGFRTRMSERLRHKNRALLPRDYEQLALEQFPDLAKVKCFSSLSWAEEAVIPGRVLVVVVPRVDDGDAGACRRARVDARRLEEIGDYLDRLSPAFVKPEVINPVYEQIQVRCTVRFADPLSEGINLERLDRQISDYLCPWKTPGYRARFGWSIRQRDLESYLLDLDHIDFVTNFSMLHITVDRDGKYSLFDTARDESGHAAEIRPRYPWSLAIPMRHHALETTREARPIEANVTGVDELEVGATFIIGSGEYGEED